MISVGILAAWFGYAVFYYGLDIVTGGNDTFVSLIWPGKYAVTAKDGGTGAPTVAAQKKIDATSAAQDAAGKPALGAGGLGTGNTPTGLVPPP